jgi:hypothetical protein
VDEDEEYNIIIKTGIILLAKLTQILFTWMINIAKTFTFTSVRTIHNISDNLSYILGY